MIDIHSVHLPLSGLGPLSWYVVPIGLSAIINPLPSQCQDSLKTDRKKRAEPHQDQLLSAKPPCHDEIQDHRRQVDTRFWFLHNKEGFQMVSYELKTGILM